jgi:hypothetical protein
MIDVEFNVELSDGRRIACCAQGSVEPEESFEHGYTAPREIILNTLIAREFKSKTDQVGQEVEAHDIPDIWPNLEEIARMKISQSDLDAAEDGGDSYDEEESDQNTSEAS